DASEAVSKSAQTETGESGGARENRSRVLATILEVVPQTESKFYLRMRVESTDAVAGFENVAKVGDILEAYPNFKRQEGRAINMATEENQHLLQAQNLQAGAQIIAIVYYRQTGAKNVVLLMDWQKH
ncbi:hypothetical protein MJD09_14790, partial [bacterium]|nr:hypothetical protein [bacterium]